MVLFAFALIGLVLLLLWALHDMTGDDVDTRAFKSGDDVDERPDATDDR